MGTVQSFTPNTDVTFLYPGISGVKLDGTATVPVDKGPSFCVVRLVNPGVFSVELL